MITLDRIDNVLALDSGIHVEKLGYLTKQEPHMGGFRACWSCGWSVCTAPATVAILKGSDVGRGLVRAADHAKEAIG